MFRESYLLFEGTIKVRFENNEILIDVVDPQADPQFIAALKKTTWEMISGKLEKTLTRIN